MKNLFKVKWISVSIKETLLLIICLVIAPTLQLSAKDTSYAQIELLTLKIENKTLKEVFTEIESKSEFVFLYYDNLINSKHKVYINVKKQPINRILDKIFVDTNLYYEIEDRQIIIVPKDPTPSTSPIVQEKQQQSAKIKGKIVDETGEPMPGVTIVVAGSTRGVTTDLDGSFEIDIKKTDKLQISFLGYQEQTIDVGDRKEIIIQLVPKLNELNEVVVVAFGKQKKESVIGAITTLSPTTLKTPVGKISTSLAGQMAGIVAVQRSGEPGAGSDFWIRGISTFGSNSRPLVLVDGIERPMDLVDPEDIESFSILKDATATAVYGVRGANGIILITTKRGHEGKFTINAKAEFGVLAPIRMPKLANGAQWIDYYNDITFEATGQIPYPDPIKQKYLDGSDPDLYPNINWMDEIFRSATTSQRVNINISGGGQKIRYYVAGSFYTENGIYDSQVGKEYNPELRYNKYNFRSNLDIDITPSTTVTLNLSNQYESKNRPGNSDMWTNTMITTPIITPTIFSDGTLASPPLGSNPWNVLNKSGYSNDFWNNAQSLVGVTQDFSKIITPGLEANIKFSWDATNGASLYRTKNPSTYYAVGRNEDGSLDLRLNNEGNDYLSLGKDNWGSRTINLEASLTYDRLFGDAHRVGGLFLFNMREHNNNFPGDYIAAFAFRNQGLAARATYSYMDKYFIEGNFGYNGSENFAPNKRFGFFPSIAVGYLISNESYFEPFTSVISLLKLKASYGEIGNDQIGGNRRFAFNSEMKWEWYEDNWWERPKGYQFGSNGQNGLSGIATGYLGNPNVSWETAKKSNIGIELTLFNKLRIQNDYFHEKREGIFIPQESVPSIVGNNETQYVNLGKMINQGVDGSLEYNEFFNKDFFIQARANFTFNRNKRLYDDKPTPVWPYQALAGFVDGQQTGLVALGLFESQEEIDNHPKQMFGTVRPGDIKYKDINGDGVVDSYDVIAIGRTDVPEVNYGFGASIGWKGIDASVFFQGTGRATRFIGGSPIYGQAGNILIQGQLYSEVADGRWTVNNPNPKAKYPRMSLAANENNRRNSTFYQRDVSFLRLKNVELGYTIPRKITNKIGFSTVRIYVQGVNLLTFSKFKLWDPELNTGSGDIYPQMRTINFGLNINI